MIHRRAFPAMLIVLALAGTAHAQRSSSINSINEGDTKKSRALIDVFRPVVRSATKSTVSVRVQKEGILTRAALGTVVSADGYVLTKGSEVLGLSMVTVQIDDGGTGQELDATVVGYSDKLDLAMLKVNAKNLTPAIFADTRPPEEAPATAPAILPTTAPVAATATAPATAPALGRGRGGRGGRDNGGPLPAVATMPSPPPGAVRVDVGEWVATTEAGGSFRGDLYPRSVGVISTPRRAIARVQGYLGIKLVNSYDDSAARVEEVIEGSNAQRSGLKADDLITAVNGTPTPDSGTLRSLLTQKSRGDIVTLNVTRDYDYLTRSGKSFTLRCQLGTDPSPDTEEQEMLILSGQVNRRSGDFPAVFQHDTELNPQDCGGPLVDLEGRIIGINIARAGRTESYAIPADLIIPLIEPMKAGKMPPPTDLQAK